MVDMEITSIELPRSQFFQSVGVAVTVDNPPRIAVMMANRLDDGALVAGAAGVMTADEASVLLRSLRGAIREAKKWRS